MGLMVEREAGKKSRGWEESKEAGNADPWRLGALRQDILLALSTAVGHVMSRT